MGEARAAETPFGQVGARRIHTKRERMTLVNDVLPEAELWPTSGTRGSGLLDEKKPMWGGEEGADVGRVSARRQRNSRK